MGPLLAVPAAVEIGLLVAGGVAGTAIVAGSTTYFVRRVMRRPNLPKQFARALLALTGQTADQLRSKARNRLGIDTDNKYNFGICGTSGSGKSTLVNGVRGLRNSDADAAKVGTTQTTMAITPYVILDEQREESAAVVWDIPGGSTPEHKLEDYFMDQTLYAFDTLVVVTATRFTELDLAIARQADMFNVPVVFVRNKADSDVREKCYDTGASPEEAQAIVKMEVRNDLAAAGLPNAKLFLISAKVIADPAIGKYEELELINYVTDVAYRARNPVDASNPSSLATVD